MKFQINRKGSGESLMFFAFIFILFIILAGIVLGVSAFYGRGYDFRLVEANVLSDRVEKCFMDNDFFEPGFNKSIFSKCGMHENVEDEHLIYVNRISDGKEFFIGVLDYKNQCFLKGAEKNPNFPKCKSQTITKQGENFELIIGANQKSRRIKV